jgi:DNA-binding CsgD family transcriptional regulator
MKLDIIQAVESCYAPADADEAWLRGVLDALAPLDCGLGIVAQLYWFDRSGARTVEARAATDPSLTRQMDEFDAQFTPTTRPPELWEAATPVDFGLRRAQSMGSQARAMLAQFFAETGTQDALGIFAAEPGGRTLLVTMPIAIGRRRPGPRTIHRLKLFAVHLGAAARLRRAVALASPDAVLDPGGRLLDATGEAAERDARPALSDAVRCMERARGALRRSDPDEAIAIWRGLVAGTWSLVDRCERDGKRYVLARRNRPDVEDPKALTPRERAVVAFAAMGHQNKYIGYALGLSTAGIAALLRSAARKLGLPTRAALIRELAPLIRGEPPMPRVGDEAR